MAKRHKKHHEEGEMGEAWLLPYSDLMTLLLAVFIVLFAVSKQDAAKTSQMAQAFKSIFQGGEGVLDSGTTILPGNPPAVQVPGSMLPDILEKMKNQQQNAKEDMLESLQAAFKSYMAENNLNDQLEITEKGEGLLITLKSDVWFPLGSASINESHKLIAKEVASMIAETDKTSNNLHFKIIVTGHTDNVPIHNAAFTSNWGLSVSRAANFLEALLDSTALNPAACSARGMGEYEPIDTNDTPEGRQRNRRVEVFISFDE